MTLTVDRVKDALKNVMDPEINKPLLELGMIDDIAVDNGKVTLTVFLTTPACPLKNKIKEDVEQALSSLDGLVETHVKMDARTLGSQGHQESIAPGVKNFIAVASGKGGVGKSTTAVNLALALSESGARVGLMDADVYGPSIPHMLGTGTQVPEVRTQSIIPLEIHGLKVMSLGFFVPPDQAVVWRGPMMHKAINQSLGDVRWGDLDYLIIDLPPGTGDVQLSLVQLIPLTGAVVVSTPQDISLIDVRKAMAMFKTTNTKVFGMIENMSQFTCPNCETQTPIFGRGGVEKEAQSLGLPLLGQVPIRLAIREGSDSGKPPFFDDAATREEFMSIAGQLASHISQYHASGQKPERVVAQ